MNAEQFNALYPVGTPVFAYPGFRPEDASDARRLVTRTRTAAQVSASGHPVVWVEGEGAYIRLTHVDPVSEHVWKEARAAETPAVSQEKPTSTRLTPEREAEIAARRYTLRSVAAADVDIDALLAELAAVRAERNQAQAELAKYVGKEPTVVEEMTHLNHCLNAVYDLCDEAKRSNSLCITIEAVEQAADGARADDPNDNRRRIYIDGNGRAWIDTGVDNGGLRWIASIDDRAMEATREAVTAETGSLREIGRCW